MLRSEPPTYFHINHNNDQKLLKKTNETNQKELTNFEKGCINGKNAPIVLKLYVLLIIQKPIS